MSKIYRVVWNALKHTYVAVNELTGTAQSRGTSALVRAAVVGTAALAAAGANAYDATTQDFYVGDPEEQMNSQPGYKGMVPGYIAGQNYVEDDLYDTSISLTVPEGQKGRVFVGNYHYLELTGNGDGKVRLDGVDEIFAIASGTLVIRDAINGLADGALPSIYVGMVGEGGASENGTFAVEKSKIAINRLLTAKQTTVDANSELTVMNGIRLGSSSGVLNSFIRNNGTINTKLIEQNVNESGPQSVQNYGTLNVSETWDSNAQLVNGQSGVVNTGSLTLRFGRDAQAQGDVSEWSENSGELNVKDEFKIVRNTTYGTGSELTGKFRNKTRGFVRVGEAETKAGRLIVDGDYENEGQTAVYGTAEVTDDGKLTIADGSSFSVTGNMTVKGEITQNGSLSAGNLEITNSAITTDEETHQQSFASKTVNNGTITVAQNFVIGNNGIKGGNFENLAGHSVHVGSEETRGMMTVAGGLRNRGELDVYGDALVTETGSLTANTGGVTTVAGDLTVKGALTVRTGGTLRAGTVNIDEQAGNQVQVMGELKTGDFKYAGSVLLSGEGVIDANKLIAASEESMPSLGTGLGTIYAKESEGNVALSVDRFVVKAGGNYDQGNGIINANKVEVQEGATLKSSFTSRQAGDFVSLKIAQGATAVVNGIHGGTGDRPAEGDLPGYTDYTKIDQLESNGGNIVFENAWQDGKRVIGDIVEGSTFNSVTIVGGVGNDNGQPKGFNLDVDVESGRWFDNTRITYQNGSEDILVLRDRGENNTYVLSRNGFMEDNSKTANYYLARLGDGTNDYDVVDGSTLKVGTVGLGNPNAGRVTLTNGTLEVALGELFDGVSSDGSITGVDMEDGHEVHVPLGGIQTVGQLRNGVTDLIGTTENGNLAFTDAGWTQQALAAVTDRLTHAYGQMGTITFVNGDEEFESDGFTVVTANSVSTANTNGLIFADTNLVNRTSDTDTAAKLTFGTEDAAEGNTVKGDFGFRAIEQANEVTVEGGRKLYLVGYANPDGDIRLLKDAEDGGRIELRDGTLTLGGASAGTTYGSLGNLAMTDAKAKVNVQNGVFNIGDTLSAVEGSTLNIKKTGRLNVNEIGDAFAGTLVNEGTLHAEGDVTLTNADNRGTGVIEAAGQLTMKATGEEAAVNAGKLTGGTGVALEGNWVNSGSISHGDAEGAMLTHANGRLENAGTITAASAEVDALVNSSTIDVDALLDATTVRNNLGGVIAAGSLTTDEGFVFNEGTIVVDGVLAAGGEIINRGKITAASMTAANGLSTGANGSTEVTGDVQVSGTFYNAGTFTADTLTAELAAEAVLDNARLLEVTALNVTGPEGASGTIANRAGALLSVTGEDGLTVGRLENAGAVSLAGNLTADTITNAVTGTIAVEGNVTVTEAFVNEGFVEAAKLSAEAGLTNKGSISVAELDTDTLTSTEKAVIEVTGDAALVFATVDNNGLIRVAGDLSAEALANGEKGIVASAGHVAVTGEDGLANRGTIRAQSLSAEGVSNAGTIELTGILSAGSAALENTGSVTVAAIESAGIANSGTIRLTSSDAAITVSEAKPFENTGSISGLETFTVEDDAENAGTIEASKAVVAEGVLFENAEGAKLGVTDLVIDGMLANSGEVTAVTTKIGEEGVLAQTDMAVFTTDTMQVANNAYTHTAGTVVVKNGIEFTGTGPWTINVTEGQELVLSMSDLSGSTVNVTKRLTVGAEKGFADRLAAESPELAAKLADATGVLTLGKGLKLDADSHLSIGTLHAPAVAAMTYRAAPRASAAEGNLNAAAGSVTIADAAAVNGAPLFEATCEGVTAVIDPSASLVITRVEHDGDMVILKGFDLSANVGADNAWTGGWTGDNALFVNDGSGLDYDVETRLENGNFVANLTMADVSTVYTGIAAPDVVNAALKNRGEGKDVEFLRSVIRDRDMTVDGKTKIVNSVMQIGAAAGVTANFLADATSLVTTVEERASVLSHEGTGLWVRAEGGKAAQDGLKLAGSGEAGYDATVYGFTFGADTAVRSDLTIGAAFSYLKGSADAEGDVLAAANDYDTFGIQTYAAWTPCEQGRLIGDVGVFRTSGDVKQTIGLADFSEATADPDATAVTLGIRAEGIFDVNGVKVVPHVGLRGVYIASSDYTTKIDGKDAFRNDQDNTFTVQMPIGVAVEKAFDTASGWTVVPNADFTVTPQFGDTDAKTVVTGIGAEASQSMKADIAGNVTIRTAFGLTAKNGNAEISAKYAFTGGDAGRKDHAFMIGASYRF